MNTLREAAQQALEAIEALESLSDWEERVLGRLCDKLRAALAEPDHFPDATKMVPVAKLVPGTMKSSHAPQPKAEPNQLDDINVVDMAAPQSKAEQEPVAWIWETAGHKQAHLHGPYEGLGEHWTVTPLYTAPQPRLDAAAIRAAALEEAAEYLESIHRTRLVKFADAIRVLKEKT
jgi:hypothetical protein